MEQLHALLALACTCLCAMSSVAGLTAEHGYSGASSLFCQFTAKSTVTNTCDTNLRQVFKLLSVDSSTVLIGSTECLYAMDTDLSNVRSTPIKLAANDETTCGFAIQQEMREFRCKNYMSYAHPLSTSSSYTSSSYRACGTYSSQNPMCWQCSINSTSVNCMDGVETAFMPKTPTQNFTVTRTTDGSQESYFMGGIYSHTSSDNILAKVPIDLDNDVRSGTVETDQNKDGILYQPTNFVGEPMEHNGFIYFFFRERAKEYDNIGRIIYSRVARVCKNDTGGITSPLRDQFLTYLKTRLTCSTGSKYPYYFDEIQDVKRSTFDPSLVYGLFTSPNAGSSSTAVCRYNLDELEVLFNEDFRRGQPSATQLWQSISRHSDDTIETRTCQRMYNFLTDNSYTHLKNNPLMNTNAPNCGFGTTCNVYSRVSDEALAVFERIRGQQMALLDEDATQVKLYMGTNNQTIYKVCINALSAVVTEKLILESVPEMTEAQRQDKWPYGVSYLQIHNQKVYGTLDNCAFMFTPQTTDCTTSYMIVDRTPGGGTGRLMHSMNIPNAVTWVFRLFEAPEGAGLYATFDSSSKLDCDQRRFSSGSGREFLHVNCKVENLNSPLREDITVTGSAEGLQSRVVSIEIDIDDSAKQSSTDADEINNYDKLVAKYEYNFQEWLKTVTCDGAPMDTCSNAAMPGY